MVTENGDIADRIDALIEARRKLRKSRSKTLDRAVQIIRSLPYNLKEHCDRESRLPYEFAPIVYDPTRELILRAVYDPNVAQEFYEREMEMRRGPIIPSTSSGRDDDRKGLPDDW